MKKHNAGFTLIELIVAMAMATIVTAAATSVLLMGLRINRQTGDTASQQITVRQLLTVMENAAADGNITAVETYLGEGEEEKIGSWQLTDEDGEAIFEYNATEQKICTNGTPVLEGVIASNAIIEGQLLSISIETKNGTYTSTVYCRLSVATDPSDEESLPGASDQIGRGTFLDILKKEYRSRGEIKNPYNNDQYTYYSEWYIQGYKNGWNADTPWCACYVSWALSHPDVSQYLAETPQERWFANVDEFMAYFRGNSTWKDRGTYTPQEGDLIFFDWDKGTDPEHVGVVLKAENGLIYTIEGNSAGRVTIRTYPLNDARIIGYGVLPWQPS